MRSLLPDPLFKGLTRPAMLFGVPLLPLLMVCGAHLLFAVWISIWLILLVLPLVLLMRLLAQSDEQKFRLLWLRFYFRILDPNHNHRFWRASRYDPLATRKEKK